MKFQQSVTTKQLVTSIDMPAWNAAVSKRSLMRALRLLSQEWITDAETRRIWRLLLLQLETYRFERLQADEAVVAAFLAWLRSDESDCPDRQAGGVANLLNRALDEIGRRKSIFQRSLTSVTSYSRRDRLRRLTPETRKALVRYEEAGKKISVEKIHVQMPDGSTKMRRRFTLQRGGVAPYARANRIGRFLQLVEILNVTCARQVTPDAIRELLFDRPDFAPKILTELESVFANFAAMGLLPVSPLAEIEYDMPPRNVRSDFVPQEGVNRLLKLAADERQTRALSVRSATMAAFLYDSALRIREATAVLVSDIQDDPERDLMTLTVRGEIQKGQGKMTRLFVIYFPETRRAIRRYLAVYRSKLRPKTDFLFISTKGGRMTASAASRDLQVLCERHGIQTHGGKTPTPHVLRHAFATLNVAPLGLALSLDEITVRLRHNSRELARRVYVEDNPCLELAKHAERVSASVQMTGQGCSSSLAAESVLEWVERELVLPEAVLQAFREAVDRRVRPAPPPAWERGIDEREALALLSDFAVDPEDLQCYFSSIGKATHTTDGWVYEEDAVWRFRKEFVDLSTAIGILNVSRATIYNNADKLGAVRLGRRRFISRAGLRRYAATCRKKRFET